MIIDYDFCISSYLTFRYVIRDGIGWKSGVAPELPDSTEQGEFKVKTANEIFKKLRQIVSQTCKGVKVGVLLSGGMDSSTIAALMPAETHAYTVQFVAEGAVNEALQARLIAKRLGLKHTTVRVTWGDYNDSMDFLMDKKKAPLHPAEVGLYKAASVASADGIKLLAVGNGADSTFGGMDKLLSKDWTFDEFVKRYTFLEPVRVVKKPVAMTDIFERYRRGDSIDVVNFLKVVHGLGIVQMFENAIESGGCLMVAPFEKLSLDTPLDLKRIRSGDTKYLLREVFRELYPGFNIPEKIAFARPVTQWLKSWPGPARPEFLDNLSMADFSGEQKWQLYCLERFLNLLDKGKVLANG